MRIDSVKDTAPTGAIMNSWKARPLEACAPAGVNMYME